MNDDDRPNLVSCATNIRYKILANPVSEYFDRFTVRPVAGQKLLLDLEVRVANLQLPSTSYLNNQAREGAVQSVVRAELEAIASSLVGITQEIYNPNKKFQVPVPTYQEPKQQDGKGLPSVSFMAHFAAGPEEGAALPGDKRLELMQTVFRNFSPPGFYPDSR